jgi:LytS/YehU family sensor histidine kinase
MVNVFGACMYFLNKFYNKTIPWNRNRSTRFLLEFCSGIIILGILAGIYVYAYLEQTIINDPESNFWEQYSDGAIKFGIIAIVITYLYSLINFSIFSYNQYSFMQIETLRIERHQLNLQFEALKSQLSPHFLFNALNTISSLIYRDIKQSDKFIRRLASTYQYILKTDDKKLVRFSHELDMVKSYFYMQKIRYGDIFKYEIAIDNKTLDSLIPPLTLQMLAENALKHNLVGEDIELEIKFSQNTSGQIVVSNNIVKKPELVKIGNNLLDRPKSDGSHKMGLKNIRSRYQYFTNRKIEIEIDKNFTVKLPIIYQQSE